MKNSSIEWTNHTFNPWEGCTKVSPGCLNCYAETLNARWGGTNWGKGAPRKPRSDAYWREPLKWNEAAKKEWVRPRVFCASMADVFDQEVPDEWRVRLFDTIRATPTLDWLLLTKRPEHIWIPDTLPTDNIWLGVSAEDQARWNERVPILLDNPAAVHFVSAEPLLGPIDPDLAPDARMPDWIIIGGESGPKCRSMEERWAIDLINIARNQGTEVKIFVKQMGGHPNKRGKLDDIPEPLRIREFPEP